MLIKEIVNSCSNDHVAQAALGSIGGVFAARIEALAERDGLKGGTFAAGHVSSFKNSASARDWNALRDAIRFDDQPVLAGLRYILEQAISARCRREAHLPGLASLRATMAGAPQACMPGC